MMQFRTLLLLGSAVALAACDGANTIASPGEGVIVIPAPTPAPAPAPAPTPTPTPTPGIGVPADNCPNDLTPAGTIAGRLICQMSGTYTGAIRLRNLRGVIYSLNGRVNIGQDRGANPDAPIAGAVAGTLTIDPGVKIFGSSGADSLVINRGSQIFAEGTANNPIIMTARANIAGTTNPDSIGLWGGLVLLGRAPIHTCIGGGSTPGTVDCQNNIEGLTNAFYGGATVTDSTGRIEYLQVRYPGFEVAPGNELNGITLGGVGSGTFMEHVQVHNSSDDGIEWFGGRVNHRYLVVTGADDDSIDTDFGYRGFQQFVVVVQRSGGGDRIIEAETSGFEARTPRSFPRIVNFTFVNRRTPQPILLRGGTEYALVNGLISATASSCLIINNAQTVAAADGNTGANVDQSTRELGPPIFRSVLFGCVAPAVAGTDVPLETTTGLITGNNNVLNYVPTLIDTIMPGATETAAVATNPTFLGGPLTNANYVGAFQNASDRWFNGWTCGLAGQVSCEAVPADNGN